MDRFTSALPVSVASIWNRVESIAEAAIQAVQQSNVQQPAYYAVDLSNSVNVTALIFDSSQESCCSAALQSINPITSLIISLGESPFSQSAVQSLNCIDLSMAGHAAPPLPSLAVACAACRRWCELNPEHRVCVHANISTVQRAALTIAMIWAHFDVSLTATYGIETVTQKLTDAGLQCWLNPSQTRYASEYFTYWLSEQSVNCSARVIDRIIVSGEPSNQTIKRTGRVYCQIFNGGVLVASKFGRDQVSWLENGSIVYEVQCPVIGDVLIRLRHVNTETERTESVVRFQLHTSVMESVLRLTADQLDGNQPVYRLQILDLMSTTCEANTPLLEQQAKEMERAITVLRDRRPLRKDTAESGENHNKLLSSAVRAAHSLVAKFSLFADDCEAAEDPTNNANTVEQITQPNTAQNAEDADSDDDLDTAIADDIDLDEDLDLDSELDDDEARELLEAINELEDHKQHKAPR